MASREGNALSVWFGLNAGGAVFIGVWVYGIVSNDWVLGFIFGWIPALIMGAVAGVGVYGLTQGLTGLVAPHVSSSKHPPPDSSTGLPAQ